MEQSLAEEKATNENLTKQLETANNSLSDLQKQLENQGLHMQQLESEVAQKSSEITSKEEDIVKSRIEITRSARDLEDLKKKMLATEKAKEELSIDRGRLKTEISSLKTQIIEYKHQVRVLLFFDQSPYFINNKQPIKRVSVGHVTTFNFANFVFRRL